MLRWFVLDQPRSIAVGLRGSVTGTPAAITCAVMMTSTSSPRLLVVDDEEEILWTIRQCFEKESYIVDTASDGLSALDFLKRREVDVLIADIRMPRMSGVELVIAARRQFPNLAVVMMTAYSSPELLAEVKANTTIEYLEKPFELAGLFAAVTRARARTPGGFTGAISVQTLPDVVQLYALSNARGALLVRCSGRAGTIWFDGGTISHAEVDDLAGAAAFYEILGWSGGSFDMRLGEHAPRRSIVVGWMELVLEGCRRADESSGRRISTRPPTEPTERDSELSFVSQIPPPSFSFISSPIAKDNHMQSYKESLAKLESVDGFIGGCLCDSESGMLMGAVGGGAALNLEIAGATNTEVLRAKRKAAKALGLKDDIEDILITLGKQYHLIRPLKAKPTVFFYLALDRSRANLAMARLSLAEVEREVAL